MQWPYNIDIMLLTWKRIYMARRNIFTILNIRYVGGLVDHYETRIHVHASSSMNQVYEKLVTFWSPRHSKHWLRT